MSSICDAGNMYQNIFNYIENNVGGSSNTSETDIMSKYTSQIERGTEYIEFHRMQTSTIRQLMRLYKGDHLNLKKTPDLSFVDECGADMGGPRKEFFHISLSSLSKVDQVYNFQLFSGKVGHLVPMYGADVSSIGCFEMAGKLIAHSVHHGCGGMVGLAPAVVKYLVCGSIEEAGELVTSSDIPDVDLRVLLEEKVFSINAVLLGGSPHTMNKIVGYRLTDFCLEGCPSH